MNVKNIKKSKNLNIGWKLLECFERDQVYNEKILNLNE